MQCKPILPFSQHLSFSALIYFANNFMGQLFPMFVIFLIQLVKYRKNLKLLQDSLIDDENRSQRDASESEDPSYFYGNGEDAQSSVQLGGEPKRKHLTFQRDKETSPGKSIQLSGSSKIESHRSPDVAKKAAMYEQRSLQSISSNISLARVLASPQSKGSTQIDLGLGGRNDSFAIVESDSIISDVSSQVKGTAFVSGSEVSPRKVDTNLLSPTSRLKASSSEMSMSATVQ